MYTQPVVELQVSAVQALLSSEITVKKVDVISGKIHTAGYLLERASGIVIARILTVN